MSSGIVDFEITARAKRYGYVIWPKTADDGVREMLGDRPSVIVHFNGEALGEKGIGWKYRRISVGPRHTRGLPDSAARFRLRLDESGALVVAVV